MELVRSTRAVKDEVDIRGYCLNCIKKHAALAQGLFSEVIERLMQGSPVSDEKVKYKMSKVFENIAHIEDHTVVNKDISDKDLTTLKKISSKANQIRAVLKDQEWALREASHSPKGTLEDVIRMSKMLDELQVYVDGSIVQYGCGECTIEILGIPKTVAPILDDKLINESLRGSKMTINSTSGDLFRGIFRGYSGILDRLFNKLSFRGKPVLDSQMLSTSVWASSVGSLMEVFMDVFLSPGWDLLGSFAFGSFLMLGASRWLTGRAQTDWTITGAQLATRPIRAGVAALSNATSQLGSAGRLATHSPFAALKAPFRSPQEVQAIIASKTKMGGLSASRLLRPASGLRQQIVPQVVDEVPIMPGRPYPTF